MRKSLLLLLIIVFYSCEKKETDYTMYGLLQEQSFLISSILQDEISKTILDYDLNNNKRVKKFDSLTKEYMVYLENINSDLIEFSGSYEELAAHKYSTDFFFNGEKLSPKGVEYISKMDTYKIEIQKLVHDENLNKRIDLIFDIPNHAKQKDQEFDYVKWYYKDMPLISIIAFLRNKQRSILEIENEFLKNELIKIKPTANTVY